MAWQIIDLVNYVESPVDTSSANAIGFGWEHPGNPPLFCADKLCADKLWAHQLWACRLNSFAASALQGNLPLASGQSRCSATAAAGLVAAAVLRLSTLHGALRLMLIQIDPTGHLTTHAANWAQITRITRLRLGFPRLLASE